MNFNKINTKFNTNYLSKSIFFMYKDSSQYSNFKKQVIIFSKYVIKFQIQNTFIINNFHFRMRMYQKYLKKNRILWKKTLKKAMNLSYVYKRKRKLYEVVSYEKTKFLFFDFFLQSRIAQFFQLCFYYFKSSSHIILTYFIFLFIVLYH